MHLIPNFSNFTIVTITISFLFLSLANCLKIPETDFAVPADDGTGSGQMDYYYSQDLSHQKHQELQQDTSEVFSKKALSTRSDEKNNIGKVPEWFKVMISSYSSQPGIFRYFHSPQYKYPYWKAINLKGQKVDFGNNKNKRYSKYRMLYVIIALVAS